MSNWLHASARYRDLSTGQVGSVHQTHAAMWFTADDADLDAHGRRIPTMLDEDMVLVPECCTCDDAEHASDCPAAKHVRRF